MSRTIEVLFMVGIFVNLVKGADLLLRPHQQKWLQAKVDSFALRLDYTRPLEWYVNQQIIRKLYLLLLGGSLFACSLICAIVADDSGIWILPLITLFPFLYIIRRVFDGRRLRFLDRLFFRKGPRRTGSPDTSFFRTNQRLQNWLFTTSSTSQSLFRPLVLVLLGGVWIGIDVGWCVGLFYLAKIATGIQTTWALLLFYLICLVPIICYFTCLILSAEPILMGIVSLLVLIFSLLLLCVEILLKLVRAIVWRIAEYNKGAFAAITLVATVLLAIADLSIKFGWR